MFQEEHAALGALPLRSFQYFTDCERTVCDDTCIRIDHRSYAARPARIGSRVLVRLFAHHLGTRDPHDQSLLRTHARAARLGSVVLPNNERPFNPSRETHRILAQAKAIGPATDQLCRSLFAQERRVGQRRSWGTVALARRYPRSLIDQACSMALHDGVTSYKQIHALTERLTTAALASLDTPVQGELTSVQDHALIRYGDGYADLFILGALQSAALPPTPEEIAP